MSLSNFSTSIGLSSFVYTNSNIQLPPPKTNEHSSKKEDESVKFIKEVLMDDFWTKEYDSDTKSVNVNCFCVTDMPGFEITRRGSVIRSGGFCLDGFEPTKIIKNSKLLAKYVKMKKLEAEIAKKADIKLDELA